MLREQNRIDRIGLHLDASSVRTLDSGMVEVWGVATRVGVFDYEDDAMPGGVFREYRPPEEVLDEKSLETLGGVPFTIDHPDEGVSSENSRELTHGWVRDVRADGDLIHVKIRISTEDAKAAIRRGMVELSCGYLAAIEDKSGVSPAGEEFDGIQRNIRYNHLALVDFARAGHVARLRLDGFRIQRKRRDTMKKFRFKKDGKMVSLPLFVGKAIALEAKAKRADEIEVAKMTVEVDGEVAEFVLPKVMVEEIMAGLGVSSGAAEPPADAGDDPLAEAPPTPAATPAAPPATPPAAAPIEEPEDGLPVPGEDPKMDKAAIKKIADNSAANAVAKYDTANKERAAIERKASAILDSAYDWSKADCVQILADTVIKVDEAMKDAITALAKEAKTSDRARGRLDSAFDTAVATHARRSDSSSTMIDAINDSQPVNGEKPKTDAAADARKLMIDRRSGKKKAS